MVYVKTAAASTPGTWTTSGDGQVVGAAITDGDLAGGGTTSFVYDPAVISLIRWNSGSFVRVNGSWRDFDQ